MVINCRKRRFFKIFLADDSQRMEIPPAFHRHITDKIPRMVALVGPSGYTWKVKLVTKPSQRGILFGDGWENFIDDHSLEFGDLLVFKFDGESSFSVFVFDKTACEKTSVSSSRPMCNCSCHERKKGKKKVVIVSDTSFEDSATVEIEEEEDLLVEEFEDKKAKRHGPSKASGGRKIEPVSAPEKKMRNHRDNGGELKIISPPRATRKHKIEEAHAKAYSFNS